MPTTGPVSTSSTPSTVTVPAPQPSSAFGSNFPTWKTREPSYTNSARTMLTEKPTASLTGMRSKELPTPLPTAMFSEISSASPTLEPSTAPTTVANRCFTSDQGNFGNLSTNSTPIDYKYEMTLNVTVMNITGTSVEMVVASLEKAISSLLLPLLIRGCGIPSQVSTLRTRRLESIDVLGIGASPQDIISSGKFFLSLHFGFNFIELVNNFSSFHLSHLKIRAQSGLALLTSYAK